MNSKQRGAFDRPAKRIKEQAQKDGKNLSFEAAQKKLAQHLQPADNKKRG